MSYQDGAKRALDIIVSLGLGVAFLPIWIVVPLLIVLTSPGPILYRHRRVGRNGREFEMYKFRSMVIDADEILHKQDKALLAKFKEGDWKLEAKDDPRITSLGRILRALTIDEFPQIYNVLKGDMSVIGPRAYLKKELKDQLKKYPQCRRDMNIVLSAKPGITGLWQVSGRNEISFDKRVKLDAQYVKGMNLWTDLKILFQTPQAMISKW
jgi:lipopolysaccharide/colanic/teichoic acid biosynthesis glycosyltransferase